MTPPEWRVRAVPDALDPETPDAAAWLVEGPRSWSIRAHEVVVTGARVEFVREGDRAVAVVRGTLRSHGKAERRRVRIAGEAEA
jgi:hypothetical protein